jgi:hypothetical protein
LIQRKVQTKRSEGVAATNAGPIVTDMKTERNDTPNAKPPATGMKIELTAQEVRFLVNYLSNDFGSSTVDELIEHLREHDQWNLKNRDCSGIA